VRIVLAIVMGAGPTGMMGLAEDGWIGAGTGELTD
jgi:hypothetical protein